MFTGLTSPPRLFLLTPFSFPGSAQELVCCPTVVAEDHGSHAKPGALSGHLHPLQASPPLSTAPYPTVDKHVSHQQRKSTLKDVPLLFLSQAVIQNSLILSLELGKGLEFALLGLVKGIYLLNFSWGLTCLPGPRSNDVSVELGDQLRI